MEESHLEDTIDQQGQFHMTTVTLCLRLSVWSLVAGHI